MDEKRRRRKRQNEKGGKPLLLVCALIIIVLLAVIVVLLLKGKGSTEVQPGVSQVEEVKEKRDTVVTEDNIEEVVDDLMQREYVEPGYYSVSMSTTWHFASGDAASKDAYVENDQKNTHDVYFDVFLEEDESEAIYESPVIPRGEKLTEVVLDKELPTGTHNCVCVYHLIDEEQNTVSTLRVGFTIVIE